MKSVRVHGAAQHLQTDVDPDGHAWDTWRIFVGGGYGTMLIVLRSTNPDWPTDLAHAWETRRKALLTGRCPECRRRTVIGPGPRGPRLTVNHLDDCPGHEYAATQALGKWVEAAKTPTEPA